MAFFKRSDDKIETDEGRVYLMKFYLDYGNNDVVYKIGLSRRERSDERLAEVVADFFKQYRYIPRCILLRDRRCNNASAKEKELHEKYADHNLVFNKRFSGSTEFFADMDEEELLLAFDW